jgi:uncharacterized membrane protein YqhA
MKYAIIESILIGGLLIVVFILTYEIFLWMNPHGF